LSRPCSTYSAEKKRLKSFGGITCRKEVLGRYRLRWGNNIKIALKEGGGERVNWIDMAKNRRSSAGCYEHCN
jgi:hypothetical protein